MNPLWIWRGGGSSINFCSCPTLAKLDHPGSQPSLKPRSTYLYYELQDRRTCQPKNISKGDFEFCVCVRASCSHVRIKQDHRREKHLHFTKLFRDFSCWCHAGWEKQSKGEKTHSNLVQCSAYEKPRWKKQQQYKMTSFDFYLPIQSGTWEVKTQATEHRNWQVASRNLAIIPAEEQKEQKRQTGQKGIKANK